MKVRALHSEKKRHQQTGLAWLPQMLSRRQACLGAAVPRAATPASGFARLAGRSARRTAALSRTESRAEFPVAHVSPAGSTESAVQKTARCDRWALRFV